MLANKDGRIKISPGVGWIKSKPGGGFKGNWTRRKI
jgi:hypothetical protein